MNDFSGLWFDCEDVDTQSSEDQCSCEIECSRFLKSFTTICYTEEKLKTFLDIGLLNNNNEIKLLRVKHCNYLVEGIVGRLSSGFVSLDASRPWICYWILHALYLLNNEPLHIYSNVIKTLEHMQNDYGGFSGGPSQISHCAPNYAAVLTLCTIGTMEAYSIINRSAMYNYFLSLKHSNGGFCIHHDGEVDSRGTYTVIAIARILNILTKELIDGVANYLLQCQTYEGGFGGEPGNEAHGGYNFCALAALLILNEIHRCDMIAQEQWLLNRQVRLEGGFQGRTNKLVDSCYSFWQGSAMAIVQIVKNHGSDVYDMEEYLKLLDNNNNKNDINDNNNYENINNNDDSDDDICTSTGGRSRNNNTKINQSHQRTSSSSSSSSSSSTNNNNVFMSTIHAVTETSGTLPFNQHALQRYILHCAQSIENGGMRDKPGKPRDYYHSCYALSGLSISQCCVVSSGGSSGSSSSSSSSNSSGGSGGDDGDNNDGYTSTGEMDCIGNSFEGSSGSSSSSSSYSQENMKTTAFTDWTGAQVYGDPDNLLNPTSAIYNIGLKKLNSALQYFNKLTSNHHELLEQYINNNDNNHNYK